MPTHKEIAEHKARNSHVADPLREMINAFSPAVKAKEPDIVDVLDFWQGRDDVPDDLSQYLAVAADEIRGLREEVKYYRNIIDEASPRF